MMAKTQLVAMGLLSSSILCLLDPVAAFAEKAFKSISCSVVLSLDKDTEQANLSVQSRFVRITEDSRNDTYIACEEETWNFPPIPIAGGSGAETIGTSNAWAAINIAKLPADGTGNTTDLYRIEFTSLYGSDVFFEIATNVTLEAGTSFEVSADRSQAASRLQIQELNDHR